MARGTQLSQLLQQLRVALGDSVRTTTGVDTADSYRIALAKTQEILHDRHNWQFMNYRPMKDLEAGARFYDWPTDLDLETVQQVYAVDAEGKYTKTERGITADLYSNVQDERKDPVTHWDVRWTGTADQLEVFPTPESATKLHLFGKKVLAPLVNSDDRADLDDNLIVLHTAVPILARNDDAAAQVTAREAERLWITLTGKTSIGRAPMSMLPTGVKSSGFYTPWDYSSYDTYWGTFYGDTNNFLSIPTP